jgi:hypothetical protein
VIDIGSQTQVIEKDERDGMIKKTATTEEGNIINYARSRAQRCQIVEERDKTGKPTGRRYATIQQVQSVGGAIHLLRKIESGEIV